jgi:type IV pilus assembly protein PilM
MAKGKNLLGLDIGASTVKACLLQDTKKGYRLQVFDMVDIPSETIVDGAIMNSAAIVDAIRELMTRNRIRQKECAMAVSGYSVVVKRVTLPLMTPEELRESIRFEAEQHIPFDIEDMYLDFWELAHRPAQGSMDVLLVAAKKDVVNDYTAVAREAGLQPTVMDVEACCLQNMFELSYNPGSGETVVLIDIGSSVTNINVYSEGVITFTRGVAMAGNLFTEEIQKQLNITSEEAESYKRGGSDSGSDALVPEEVDRVMAQVAEAIANEVQRTLDFYSATSAQSLFSKIYLSGGSARIPVLGRTIAKTCGVMVELLNPFRAIAWDPKQFNEAFLEQVSPGAGVAVGLALRRSIES